jgi:hypothetical protein
MLSVAAGRLRMCSRTRVVCSSGIITWMTNGPQNAAPLPLRKSALIFVPSGIDSPICTSLGWSLLTSPTLAASAHDMIRSSHTSGRLISFASRVNCSIVSGALLYGFTADFGAWCRCGSLLPQCHFRFRCRRWCNVPSFRVAPFA